MSDATLLRAEWLPRYGAQAWGLMSLIREIENRLAGYLQRGYIRGSTHPSVGMEAVAVGVSLNLQAADLITSTHRGHGHCLAKGAEPERVLAELFGRSSGYCGGKGGSMHLAARELGILGTNGIVGASVGLATGAALAARQRATGRVAAAYFGEGGINQGIFHEALNLAAIWKLPCIYVCENNHYAQSSPVEEMASVRDLSIRAHAYGIPGVNVDGMDVYAVWTAAHEAVARAQRGEGPTLIIADTYRFLGHMVGDTEMYRSATERDSWKGRDPITRLETELINAGVASDRSLNEMQGAIAACVDVAERNALAAPEPAPEEAYQGVYGGVSP
ncbi:MAG TPA: thiamine pyrophosphate-dependent dehydrogenase E1 component subunit alpha [bacterium]|nr:thiamine pyrophosphate-dependent dehydrogenase E1 component subunit alpha [bacterium]